MPEEFFQEVFQAFYKLFQTVIQTHMKKQKAPVKTTMQL